MSISIKELINNFDNFISKSSIKDNVFNEIECILLKPNFKLLDNMFRYEHNKSTYIEAVLRSNEDKNVKIRKRVMYNTTFEINNIGLIDNINDIDWEKKTLIASETLHKDIIFNHSLEEEFKLMPKELILNKISLHYVISVSIVVSNTRLTFKIKYYLGAADDKKLILAYILRNIFKTRKYISISLDVEIVELKEYKIDNLFTSFAYLFGCSDIENLKIDYDVKINLNTNMITYDELLRFSGDMLQNYMLTGKVDGDTVTYDVNDSYCTLNLNGIIYRYKCNICNKYSFSGIGELVKIKSSRLDKYETHIYPFYIHNINNETMSREQSLETYNSKLIRRPDDSDKIIFKEKKISGPYDDIKELLLDSIMYLDQPMYDGVVLLDTSNNKNIIDFKFKLDNTIDLICVLNIDNDIYIQKSDGIYIMFDLYVFDKSFIKKSSVFEKVNDRFSVILNNILIFNENGKKVIVPHIFIGEYSYVKNKIIKVRQFKTCKFYYFDYNGNHIKIIEQSRNFHTNFKLFDVAFIKSQCKSNLINDIDQGNYFLINTTRTSLNISTNIIKTNCISMATSSIVNSARNKSVLVIDIGRGGDMNKYYYVGIKSMVGTDPNKACLNEASKRYKDARLSREKKSGMYSLELINKSILEHDYVKSIKKLNMANHFNIIDWQFAIHYSYNDTTKKDILNKLQQLSICGTRVIITCLDGDKVADLLINNDTITFSISDEHTYNIKKIPDNDSIVSVYYTASMSKYMVENLIRSSIIDDFRNYGFELVDKYSFEKFINKDRIHMYEVLSKAERSSTRRFYETILNDKNLLTNQDILNLLKLNVVMVFEKRDSIK